MTPDDLNQALFRMHTIESFLKVRGDVHHPVETSTWTSKFLKSFARFDETAYFNHKKVFDSTESGLQSFFKII
jgi:hypothetical protein